MRFRAGSHLVGKYQRGCVGMAEEEFHIGKMRGVGTEVVLYRLLIAYVDEYPGEYTHVGIGV